MKKLCGRRYWRLLVLLILIGQGCSQNAVKFKFFSAYYHYNQGDFQKTLTNYYQLENTDYQDLLHYNIGTIYQIFGEPKAALAAWADVAFSEQPLLFNLYYNRGIAEYQLGEFGRARDNFIAALQINPDDNSAKINLELSLINLATKLTRNSNDNSSSSLSDNSQRLLDFVNREERLLTPPTPSSPLEDW